jgi:hypothetical protein
MVRRKGSGRNKYWVPFVGQIVNRISVGKVWLIIFAFLLAQFPLALKADPPKPTCEMSCCHSAVQNPDACHCQVRSSEKAEPPALTLANAPSAPELLAPRCIEFPKRSVRPSANGIPPDAASSPPRAVPRSPGQNRAPPVSFA